MKAHSKRMATHQPAVVASHSDDEDAAVDPATVIRKLDRHLVPWLFALGILCYLDRTNLSFAALDLNRDLKLTCSTYGLGASLFFVSYAVFQLPSTIICAQLGAHIWLSANIVAWGAVAACFALASSVPSFLALRFLLGATESAAFPGMWYHMSTFYSEAEMGPAYAKVASCTAVAQVVGAPIAAAILAMDGVGGMRGWQWLFVIEGGATIVFGGMLRYALAPSPAKARMLTRAEREWLRHRQDTARSAMGAAGRPGSHGQGRENGGTSGTSFMHQLKATLGVVRDWRILWLSVCWLFIAAVMFGMTFFMPLLVSAMFSGGGAISGVSGGGGGGGSHSACHSGSDDDDKADGKVDQQHSALVALASAIPFMLAAVGMNINAKLAERANERHRHAGVPILLAGILLGLGPVAARFAGPGLAFALLSTTAGLCWSFHGPFFSWPAVFLPNEQAAAGFAFINSVGAIGGFVGPYLLGVLSDRGDGGFGTAMLVLACFLLASGTLILLFPAPGHREEQAVNLKASDTDEYSLAPASEHKDDVGGDMEAQQRPVGWQQRSTRHKPSSSSGQLSEVEFQPILDGARST